MCKFLRRINSTLNQLIVSKEANDPQALRFLFNNDSRFMRYQYSVAKLKQSVYNNLTLRYRHYERVNILMLLTKSMNYILDIGSGFGDLSIELSNNCKNIVLLDVDSKNLLVAKRRFSLFSLEGEFICADAQYLPFKLKTFDVTFSNQVIEHVKDPNQFILENLKVSKSRVILMCGNVFRLPGVRFVYSHLLANKPAENIPNLGDYNKIFYFNYQIFPFNSMLSVLLMIFIAKLPSFIKRIFAGNVAKVYDKKSRQEMRRIDL